MYTVYIRKSDWFESSLNRVITNPYLSKSVIKNQYRAIKGLKFGRLHCKGQVRQYQYQLSKFFNSALFSCLINECKSARIDPADKINQNKLPKLKQLISVES